MRVLICGAHFTPAYAVIEELKKVDFVDIVYVGREETLEGDSSRSQESKVLPKLGIKFIPIVAGRIQRSFTIYTIPALLKIPLGFIQALYIILKEKPDVVLSFGGYVAVPIVVAAWLFSIPVLIHEQTLVLGLANKISLYFADKIALAFNQVVDKPAVLTGNPLRCEILNPGEAGRYSRIFREAKKEKLPTILIMGGNQGSHLINVTVEKSIKKLTEIAWVIHVTGDNRFSDFDRLKKLAGDRYNVTEWIGEEYGAVLSQVDLVISRSGINTLTELAYRSKPALVIPLPYLYSDEQNKNAQFFEKMGLVKILPQSKLSADTMLLNIKIMLKNLDYLNKRGKEAGKVIIPDAAKRVALETLLLPQSNRMN